MNEANNTLGLRQSTLRLVPWSDQWPMLFAQEQMRIEAALAPLCPKIAHIGSTAVPGLLSKPILDIAMLSPEKDHASIATALVGNGYIDRGHRSGRLFIRLQGGDVRTHNLHLYGADDAEWDAQMTFRDALRSDGVLRASYARLKQDIVASLHGSRVGYAEAKTDFVRQTLAVYGKWP